MENGIEFGNWLLNLKLLFTDRLVIKTFQWYLWWLICAMSYYRVFRAKRRKGATRKPAKWWLFVFSHGDLSPRHTNVRHLSCVAFSPPVCRIFAWRGERSPCENTKKSPFGVFSRGDLSSAHSFILWWLCPGAVYGWCLYSSRNSFVLMSKIIRVIHISFCLVSHCNGERL